MCHHGWEYRCKSGATVITVSHRQAGILRVDKVNAILDEEEVQPVIYPYCTRTALSLCFDQLCFSLTRSTFLIFGDILYHFGH